MIEEVDTCVCEMLKTEEQLIESALDSARFADEFSKMDILRCFSDIGHIVSDKQFYIKKYIRAVISEFDCITNEEQQMKEGLLRKFADALE